MTSARTPIDQLRAELPGAQAAFVEPWELRVLALAVAGHDPGHFAWSEFQAALIDSIQRWDADPSPPTWRYDERCVEALEFLLADISVSCAASSFQKATEEFVDLFAYASASACERARPDGPPP